MEQDLVLRRLAAHRDELARMGVESLALFGSVARREDGPGSDVDLLVQFEGVATLDRYLELESFLEGLLGRPVDLITRRSLRPSFSLSIGKDLHYVPGLSPLPG